MTEADIERFGRLMGTLAVVHRLADLDEPTVELYFEALRDVSIELLEASMIHLARESRWFPKPAEWRRAVDRVLDRRAGPAIAGPSGQLALPGAVGEKWECPDCENTKFVTEARACSKAVCLPGPHTHTFARPCQNAECLERRRLALERKRRYSRQED